MNTCFFIGHHDAPERIFPVLLAAVEQHVAEYGVTEFVVGHYGSFDRMAAQAVRLTKEKHPTVRLTLLLPYHPSTCKPEQTAEFANYDGTYYPAGLESVPRRYAIARANRSAVERCSHLIAYLRRPTGNTRTLVDYAHRRGVHCAAL